MKKLFAILMALCLMLSCAALAEGANELNWADVEPLVEGSGITGDFVTFDEIAVKIFLPDGLLAGELTDEDYEAGYIGWFIAEDQSAQVAVMLVGMDGMSIEEYAGYLPEIGADEIEFGAVNGLPMVSYRMPENDSYNVAFATEAGNIFEVIMSPASQEGADMVWGIVAASIQEA